MPMPSLSIIIPTHERADILLQCLRQLEAQTVRDELEVIVVHDGEDAKTDALLAKETFQFPLTYFSIPKTQQGTARNRGLERATAPLTLFIGDDIFLAPDACAHHLTVHRSHAALSTPIAILGHITWDPALEITPVMRWLERTGWQFGFPFLAPYERDLIPLSMQPSFTYTSHTSLRTEIARAHPFREDILLYGWEDVEWGHRLMQAGVRLRYEPAARAVHHHAMTLRDSLRRMELLGRSAVLVNDQAPHLHLLPRGWKLQLYRLLALFPTLRGKHSRAFLRGMKD